MVLTEADEHRAAGFGVIHLPDRGVLRLSGSDRVAFLQGLVSNDVTKATPGCAVYACLLTPQGKFLHDFFVTAEGESLLIDCEADRREDLARRLRMYRLRSRIEIEDVTDLLEVLAGTTDGQDFSDAIVFEDPRIAALGRRMLAPSGVLGGPSSLGDRQRYDRLRIELGVPDGSRDMEVGKAILLENNIDLLNGIAWDKGCYMGQELTARTRYRGLIKKRLTPLRIHGKPPDVGTPLLENGIEIGEMRSSAGDVGLALLRLDFLRAKQTVVIDGTTLTPEPPGYFPLLSEES